MACLCLVSPKVPLFCSLPPFLVSTLGYIPMASEYVLELLARLHLLQFLMDVFDPSVYHFICVLPKWVHPGFTTPFSFATQLPVEFSFGAISLNHIISGPVQNGTDLENVSRWLCAMHSTFQTPTLFLNGFFSDSF